MFNSKGILHSGSQAGFYLGSLDSKLKFFVRTMSLLSGMLSKLVQLSISDITN